MTQIKTKRRWTDEEKRIAKEKRANQGPSRSSNSSTGKNDYMDRSSASRDNNKNDSSSNSYAKNSNRTIIDDNSSSGYNDRNSISGRRSRQRIGGHGDDDNNTKYNDNRNQKPRSSTRSSSPPSSFSRTKQDEQRSQSMDVDQRRDGRINRSGSSSNFREQRMGQRPNSRQLEDKTDKGGFDRRDNYKNTKTYFTDQQQSQPKRQHQQKQSNSTGQNNNDNTASTSIRTKFDTKEKFVLPKSTPVFYDDDDGDGEIEYFTDDDDKPGSSSDSDENNSDFGNDSSDDSDDDDDTFEEQRLQKEGRSSSNTSDSNRSSSSSIRQQRSTVSNRSRTDSYDKIRVDGKTTTAVSQISTQLVSYADGAAWGNKTDNDTRNKKDENNPRKFIITPKEFNAPVMVSCHPGLEDVLSAECTALGIEHRTIPGRGVQLIPTSSITTDKKKRFDNYHTNDNDWLHTIDDVYRCALYLGSATNITIQISPESFRCRALGELERKVQTHIPWKDIISQITDDDYNTIQFKVKSTSTKSRLLHTTAIRGKVLNGIYAALGIDPPQDDSDSDADDGNNESPSNNKRTIIPLIVQFDRDKAHISIEAYTAPLHQRKYRLDVGKAPLREDIAYSLLYSAGWKPSWTIKSNNSSKRRNNKHITTQPVDLPYKSLIDPFCGSGTIPIEAAAMISGLPPGRFHKAPFDGTIWYDEQKWNDTIVESLRQSSRVDTSNIKIYASDRDAGIIKAVHANAQRAGVVDVITDIRNCSFSDHPQFDNDTSAPSKKDLNKEEGSIADESCNSSAVASDSPSKDKESTEKKVLLISNLPFGRRISPIKTSSDDNTSTKTRKIFLHTSLLPMYQKLATIVKNFGNPGTELKSKKKDKKRTNKVTSVSEHEQLDTTTVVTSEQQVHQQQFKSAMDAVILTNDTSLLIRSGFLATRPGANAKVNPNEAASTAHNETADRTLLKTSHGGIKVQGIIYTSQ
jgi:23S rRNA G2445 N2-methylase RlmL